MGSALGAFEEVVGDRDLCRKLLRDILLCEPFSVEEAHMYMERNDVLYKTQMLAGQVDVEK